MSRTFVTGAALMLACVFLSSSMVLAEGAITHPASKTIGASSSEMVVSLGVINADGATPEDGKLTLTRATTTALLAATTPTRPATSARLS
jgi:hypothetical protein